MSEREQRDPRDRSEALPPTPYEGDAEGLGEARVLERLVSLFRRESVRQRVIAPMSFDAAILVTNLVTGIIVARALGATGRGELAATLLIVQIAGWLFSMGSAEAVSFHQARKPEDGARLMTSWTLLTLPLMVVGVLASELLLPVVFAAQTGEAIDIARLYLLAMPLIALQGIFGGMVLGDHDFFYYNLTRFLYPAVTAATYGVLLVFGDFTVQSALIANAGAMAIALAINVRRSVRRHGIGPPDHALLRRTFAYGLKAHAGSTASLVNARLDLLVIPAFLSAAGVGLYSVATNVTSIITTLTGTVALMAFPVAARRGGSPRTVLRTLQTAVGISVVLAIPLAILAPVLLRLVYGAEFEEAAKALRLLLPGALFGTAINVLIAGLLAANRPLLVSVAAGVGAALTIGGLIVFLPIGGIVAAAIVTSVVFAVELCVIAELYRRTMGISWKNYLRPPAA